MIQSEDSHLGCVCPECGERCTACLGTNSVISRERILELKKDPAYAEMLLGRIMESEEDNEAN